MSSYSLELQNVSKYYAREVAINNLSFSLQKSEAVIVSGANGAGKSTLLAIIAGLIRPDAGVVKYFSTDHFSAISGNFSRQLCSRIAYQGQKVNLYFNLTLKENLELISACKKVETSKLWELIESLQLKDFLSKKLIACSQGVQKKAAIIRALLGDPELLLLDEPYANLDRDSIELISALFFKFIQQGKTVVLVTHQEGPAKELIQRRLVLEKGRLLN